MDADALSELAGKAWLWVAGPVLAIASVWLMVVMRAPQVTKLAVGFRALRAPDAGTDGDLPTAAAVALSIAAQQGAAATLAAATAVSLGGPGALGWLFLFAFLMAPLRMGEAFLARTSAPGDVAKGVPGTLAARLGRSPSLSALGSAVGFLGVLVAFAFVGGVHGGAIRELAGQLVPRGALFLGLGVAVVGAALIALGARRAGAVAAYVTLAALLVVALVALLAAMSHPSRAFGAIARAFMEPFTGSPDISAFGGAIVAEVARTSVAALLPTVAAPLGILGGVDGLARAKTKAVVAATVLGPFAAAVIGTLLVMCFVGTGAYYTAVEGDRTLDRVTVYESEFATANERLEPDRLRNGFIRVRSGALRDTSLSFATERGMIGALRFSYYGRPADIAAEVRQGHVTRLMRNRGQALSEIPLAQARRVIVHGEMSPDGPRLLVVSATSSGRGVMGQALLAALLALAAVAVFAFGLGAQRAALGLGIPARAAFVVGLSPALGIALEASGTAPWLAPFGSLAAAALATVTGVALVLESRSLGKAT